MNYRHTEPKLCHRRRQIETPTVFNNVEEIPGAKEKFLSSPPQTREARVLTELNGGGQSCYAQRRHWPTRSLSLTGPHHKFVKSRPPVAQAPGIYCLNWFSFHLWGEAPGTETLSLYGTWGGGSRTHTHSDFDRKMSGTLQVVHNRPFTQLPRYPHTHITICASEKAQTWGMSAEASKLKTRFC